jgi:hypothetical protein
VLIYDNQENIFADLNELMVCVCIVICLPAYAKNLQSIGEIKVASLNDCLDTLGHAHSGATFGIYGCHGQGGSQAFVMARTTGHIMPVEDMDYCITNQLTFKYCGSAGSEAVSAVAELSTLWSLAQSCFVGH